MPRGVCMRVLSRGCSHPYCRSPHPHLTWAWLGVLLRSRERRKTQREKKRESCACFLWPPTPSSSVPSHLRASSLHALSWTCSLLLAGGQTCSILQIPVKWHVLTDPSWSISGSIRVTLCPLLPSQDPSHSVINEELACLKLLLLEGKLCKGCHFGFVLPSSWHIVGSR